MSKIIRALILLIFLFLFSFPSFAEIKQGEGRFFLEFKNKLITVQAENISFREVLKGIRDRTGIKLVIFNEVPDQKVSLNIKALPLYALSTILEKMSLKNFVVVKDKNIEVYVLPEGKELAEFAKGKSIITIGKFNEERVITQVKGREVVNTIEGKYNVPISYIKDEVLLRFHLGVTQPEIEEILAKHQLVDIKDDALLKIGYIKVRIPDGRDVTAVLREIRQERKIKFPEPNYISKMQTVSDPFYTDQWYIADVNFDKAWTKLRSKNLIKVAVIDSGVDSSHPDLRGKILPGFDFVNTSSYFADDHGLS